MRRCLCHSHLPGLGSFQDGIRVDAPSPTNTPLCTVRPTLLVNSGRVWRRATQVEAQCGERQNDEALTRLVEATHMPMQTSATMWEGGGGARVGANLEVRVGRLSEPS